MPRYHFRVRDGVDRPDREGTELPDIGAARSEALMLAGRIIMDAGARADLGEEWRITVTDNTGLTLFLMDVCAPKVNKQRLQVLKRLSPLWEHRATDVGPFENSRGKVPRGRLLRRLSG